MGKVINRLRSRNQTGPHTRHTSIALTESAQFNEHEISTMRFGVTRIRGGEILGTKHVVTEVVANSWSS